MSLMLSLSRPVQILATIVGLGVLIGLSIYALKPKPVVAPASSTSSLSTTAPPTVQSSTTTTSSASPTSEPKAGSEPVSTQPVSPSVPPSNPTAKEFIQQASDAANKGQYRQAVTIIDQALKIYPTDQNLQLDREYYDNLAREHGQ